MIRPTLWLVEHILAIVPICGVAAHLRTRVWLIRARPCSPKGRMAPMGHQRSASAPGRRLSTSQA